MSVRWPPFGRMTTASSSRTRNADPKSATRTSAVRRPLCIAPLRPVARRAPSSVPRVVVGGGHPPGIDDEPGDDRQPRLEADPSAQAANGQEEQERVDVLAVPIAELGPPGVAGRG